MGLAEENEKQKKRNKYNKGNQGATPLEGHGLRARGLAGGDIGLEGVLPGADRSDGANGKPNSEPKTKK